MLTGFASGFVAILCLRILLGIGESVAYPCNAKFLGQRMPLATRGRANGFIASGQALRPMLGTLLGGLIMEAHGWRPAFLLFGAVSLLWLLPWLVITRGGLTAPEAMHARPLPYRVLLRERALWGTSLGHFSSNYAYYFMLTWLPVVLVRDRGFTLTGMAVIGGAAPERVLKGTMNAALLAVAIAMAGCANAGREATVALILVAGVFFGVQSAPLGTITQTLGGPRAAGQWMGVQNLCANMAGVIAPVLTGAVVDLSGNFVTAFAIAAGVTLLGTLAYAVVIRRVEPVAWPASR